MVRTIGKVVSWVVMAGLLMALLRAFDWDPFAMLDWVWNFLLGLITRISDAISANQTFQEVTSAPSTILSLFKF
jgi:hypothetical protein